MYSPVTVDQLNGLGGVLLVEGEAVFHFDAVGAIWLRHFSLDRVCATINSFTNATVIF